MANPRTPTPRLRTPVRPPVRPAPAAPVPAGTPRSGAAPGIPTPSADPAPSRTPRVTVEPPRVDPGRAAPPIAREVPADPEPTIPREPPRGLTAVEQARWCVSAIASHHRLRAKSFYDTGALLVRLMELKHVYGATDLKTLCAATGLAMSHMTANKYLRIARTFERALALEIGIEKCYALIVYAKVIGRPDEAAAILAGDERIRGAHNSVRAKRATATAIQDAIRVLKEAQKAEVVPTALIAERRAAAANAQQLARLLGMRDARAEVVRRGGEPRVAIYLAIDTAAALATLIPKALARAVPRLARSSPEAAAALERAGWRAA